MKDMLDKLLGKKAKKETKKLTAEDERRAVLAKEKEEATNEEEVEETSHPEIPHYLSVSEKMKMILKR